MDVTPYIAASSRWSSVSTFANVTSECSSDAFSKTGANRLHGPHHSAQKSIRTMPSATVSSWFSRVMVSVAIWGFAPRVGWTRFSTQPRNGRFPAHASRRPDADQSESHHDRENRGVHAHADLPGGPV